MEKVITVFSHNAFRYGGAESQIVPPCLVSLYLSLLFSRSTMTSN